MTVQHSAAIEEAKAHKVYVASCWWEDCDPFAIVVANTPEEAEKRITQTLRDAAIDAYNQSDEEDMRTVEDWMEGICWSGANSFQLCAIVRESELERYFSSVAMADLDSFDLESLLRGDADAYLWVPTA